MAFLWCLACRPEEEEVTAPLLHSTHSLSSIVKVTELDYRHCSLDDVPNEVFAYERTLEVRHLNICDIWPCLILKSIISETVDFLCSITGCPTKQFTLGFGDF